MNKKYENKEQFTPIGKVNFRNDNRVFGIKDKDRLTHIYSVGKSGTGKSTLLLNMAISDLERGNGFCILDPHGDLAEKFLDYVPQNRVEDIIYFDPADKLPLGFNPLRGIKPEYYHLVCSGLLSTFKKIWSESWGPRLEHILRFSLLTLLEYQDATLLDIQPLLTDQDFRNNVLSRVINSKLLDFWYKEFGKYSPSFKSEAISPILNKLGIFASSAILRSIIGQKENSFDLEKVMDESKILIANFAKGKLGEDVSSLLGCVLVTSIQLSAIQRAKQSEESRKPFYLYVDECHNFVTLAFCEILSECRKYGLGLYLTHQYMEQVKDEIRSAIFGNVGTLICFRVGANDAEYLSKEFEPLIEGADLVNLPKFSMYLKLMIDGATSLPFSANTMDLKPPSGVGKDLVIKCSQERILGELKAKKTLKPITLFGIELDE